VEISEAGSVKIFERIRLQAIDVLPLTRVKPREVVNSGDCQLGRLSIGLVRVSFNQLFLDSLLALFLEISKRRRNEKHLRNDVKTPPEEFLPRF
jgi:hypothetical protein